MRGVSSKVIKTLIPGSVLTCADNSGAYEFRIIHIIGKGGGGRHGKLASAGIGDIVSASVRTLPGISVLITLDDTPLIFNTNHFTISVTTKDLVLLSLLVSSIFTTSPSFAAIQSGL